MPALSRGQDREASGLRQQGPGESSTLRPVRESRTLPPIGWELEMADTTHIPPEAPGAASEPAGGGQAQKFGLTAYQAMRARIEAPKRQRVRMARAARPSRTPVTPAHELSGRGRPGALPGGVNSVNGQGKNWARIRASIENPQNSDPLVVRLRLEPHAHP